MIEEMQPLQRLTRDLRDATTTLTPREARYLVDLYYVMQEDRKRSGNQVRSMGTEEPHRVIDWVFGSMETLEGDIRRALDSYSESQRPGRWARSICGIGPVIAAGLLAHIDITQCPTAGHIWRFAGLDPTVKWLGRDRAQQMVKEELNGSRSVTVDLITRLASRTNHAPERIKAWDSKAKTLIADPGAMTPSSLAAGMARRPWNANLKTLCWKIGESFVKVSGNPNDVYGQVYLRRREYEDAKNQAGDYAGQAAAILSDKAIGHDTKAYQSYKEGRLPDGHLHARAKRYAVKLFLAHYHAVAFECQYGVEPPKPYVITHLGHAHYVAPSNWPVD